MEETSANQNIIEKVLETKTASRAQQMMQSRSGTTILALISFCESFLPLPIVTDPFLVAAILVNRSRALFLVTLTMVSSVVGGFAAYLVAVLFRELLFENLTPDMLAMLHSFVAGEQQDTFILTILGAVTPVPYTIIAWAVAITNGSPLMFILGSVFGRSFRYGVVGWSTHKFGPLAMRYAKKSILLTSAVIFILIGIYLWLHVS